MTDDPTQSAPEMTFEELRAAGEGQRKHLQDTLDVALEYDRATVEWLDGFIQRNSHRVTDEYRYGWSITLGYILGESLRRGFGGEWEYSEDLGEWAVNMGDPVGVMNPIGKVYKYLRSPYDSVLGFYDVIGQVRDSGGWDRIGQPASDRAKTPWWQRIWPRPQP